MSKTTSGVRRSLPVSDKEWDQVLEDRKRNATKDNLDLPILDSDWIRTRSNRARRNSVATVIVGKKDVQASRSFGHFPVISRNPSFLLRERSNVPTDDSKDSFDSYARLPNCSVSIELERCDKYDHFFRDNFLGKEYWTFHGFNMRHEPVVITVMKHPQTDADSEFPFFRALVRTTEEDKQSDIEAINQKILKDIKGRLKDYFQRAYGILKLTTVKENLVELEKSLLTFEDKNVIEHAKIGVLLVKEGQTTEDDMFSNAELTPQFDEFLDMLGDRITLKGFDKYKGGLDVQHGSTGQSSVYTVFDDLEIMFHVAPLLPHMDADPQQVEKKRHLGNDVTVIVFNESGKPFTHDIVHSQFNQVFAVVEPVSSSNTSPNSGTRSAMYRLTMSIKPGVPEFGPPIPSGVVFEKGPAFRDLLITKLLNGERAAYACPAFLPKIKRTRKQWMEELIKDFKK